MTHTAAESLVRQIQHLRIAYQDARRAGDARTAANLARLIASNQDRLRELSGNLSSKRGRT